MLVQVSAAKPPPPPEDQVARLPATCTTHLRTNRLTTGTGGNAADCYAQVLGRNPGNAEALAALERIAGKYRAWARKALDASKRDKARVYLNRLVRVSPEDPVLEELHGRLEVQNRARVVVAQGRAGQDRESVTGV